MRFFDPTFQIDPKAFAIAYLLNAEMPEFARNNDCPDNYDVQFSSSPFYNGREQCIAIVMHPGRFSMLKSFAVTFGECRRSELIFVDCFEPQSALNPPTLYHDYTKESYRSRQTFGEVDKAVAWIRKHFEEKYNTWHFDNPGRKFQKKNT